MTNHILRDDAVKAEMNKSSTQHLVDSYLLHLVRFKENGYEFTAEQGRQLIRLWQVTKGGRDV
jgi:hypothetical protein